jgi:DNA-binding XRE family transcriptional regulator
MTQNIAQQLGPYYVVCYEGHPCDGSSLESERLKLGLGKLVRRYVMELYDVSPAVVVDLRPMIWRWQYKHNEKLTLERLAKEVKVSRATIYRLNSGKTLQPDLRLLTLIANFLECEVTDLFVSAEESEAVDEP